MDCMPALFACAGNGATELAPATIGGDFTTAPLAEGTYWYSCQVASHCNVFHAWLAAIK
jgi:hypothetical protein